MMSASVPTSQMQYLITGIDFLPGKRISYATLKAIKNLPEKGKVFYWFRAGAATMPGRSLRPA